RDHPARARCCFSRRRRHTRARRDWSSDVCSSDLERVSTVRIYTSFPDIMNDNIDVFTLDPRVARAEGGQVYSKDVPANTVVSLPGTGLGSSVTHDVTVLNVSREEWASFRGK